MALKHNGRKYGLVLDPTFTAEVCQRRLYAIYFTQAEQEHYSVS